MNKRLMHISRTNTLFRLSIITIIVEFIAEIIYMISKHDFKSCRDRICKKALMILTLLFLSYVEYITNLKILDVFEYTFIASEIYNIWQILKSSDVPLPNKNK